MTTKNTGGPAFPGFDYINQHGKKNPEGMTLRDYFAARVVASLAKYEEFPSHLAAERAYEYADAMLEARK